MALDVSALSQYVDELAFPLTSVAILKANDMKYFTLNTKINGSERLNSLNFDLYATNDECGSTDTGTTTVAGNILVTSPINIQTSVCAAKLGKYWAGKVDAALAMGDTLGSLEPLIVDGFMTESELEIAKMRWQGANTSPKYAATTGNLTQADGVLQIAYMASATTVNVAKTAFTNSNAIIVMDSITASIPAVNRDEKNYVFISPADYDFYVMALRNADYRNFDTAITEQEYKHPGTRNTFVAAINGLDGAASGTAIATTQKNLNWGGMADALTMNTKVWYSADDNKVRFRLLANQGIQFFQNSLVVRVS